MAGNVKVASNTLNNGNVVAIELQWTGDAVNGSVPSTAVPTAKYACDGFVLCNVAVSNGPIAPTSGYTVRVFNSQSIDVLEGAGVGLTATAQSFGVSSAIPPIYGGITLSITGNTQAGASGKVVVYFRQVSTSQLVQPADPTSTASTSLSASDVTSAYMWTRTPSSSIALTGGVPVTVTLNPMPAGITGAAANKCYVSIVTGASRKAELITAVGASSITFTPTSSYAAGSWALQSASGGIQEAIYATSYKTLKVPQGVVSYDALRVWTPRKLQLTGDGSDSTIIRVRETTANVFLSDEFGWTIVGIRFEPLTGPQTAGVCVGIVGSTPQYNGDADVNVRDCEFSAMFDCVKCDWPGGFIRLENNYARSVKGYYAYHKASVAGAIQYLGNYGDGATSPGLFWIEGTLAGGIIDDNWLQAAPNHIVVNADSGVPVNELIISNNIIDQDFAGTAGIIVNGNGFEGPSSNNIQILGNYFSSDKYGVLCQDAWSVLIGGSNKFRQRAAQAAICIAGTNSGRIAITDNVITCSSAIQGYSIQVSATNTDQCLIQGNRGTATAAMLAFIGVSTAIANNLHILDNSAGANYTRMLANAGSTGAGLGVMQGNVSQNTPSVTVSAAASITLPFVDESQIVGISATGTPITEINGILARAGRRVTFLVDGAVTFATSSVADNKLAVGIGPTSANDSITWAKYSDNLWYIVAKS